MLRNTARQFNNMTIINRKLVEIARYCSHSEAIVHKRQYDVSVILHTGPFGSRPALLLSEQVSDWTTEIHPVKSIKVLKYFWCY